jgi:ribonuclease Z|tara:strand:- start:95 stop:1168 length:1074 start_codon:yes stop_codon:yes gene_type:complete
MTTNTKRGKYPEHFLPGAEKLSSDEMRITALGTGRPFLRRSQANSCWLIELGNGDKFMFDFGFGSQMNFTALEIPYNAITAYFATHLHTDHVGDFGQIWVGSWAGGRLKPLEVYGPSADKPEYGFAHFAKHQKESYRWDTESRVHALPAIGAEVNCHEFDYSKVHVIYEENGVKITSFPAVHIMDGPVSLKLEWNGLSMVYSGDTTPSEFMIENAQGVDVLIHETFNTVDQLMERSGYDERTAKAIGTMIHSDPAEAAYVVAKCKPKLFVAFHFFNDFDTAPEMYAAIRENYDGRVALATDFMVINVTKEEIVTRNAIVSEHAWPNKSEHDDFGKAERKTRPSMPDWIREKQVFPKF